MSIRNTLVKGSPTGQLAGGLLYSSSTRAIIQPGYVRLVEALLAFRDLCPVETR